MTPQTDHTRNQAPDRKIDQKIDQKPKQKIDRKTDIKELTPDRLTRWLVERGLPPYRAKQILGWVYLRQADDFESMTNLGKADRILLADHFSIDRLQIKDMEISADGTRKYLFELADGRRIETVLIPEKDHYTLCISSQVGCALGCRFCLTAQGGFQRNLTQGEILAQVRDILQTIDPKDARRLTNLVFMGMGEPLANYENLIGALSLITQGDYGLKFSPRRVTVSTSGLVPEIERLGHDTDVNLAVSLNAADNATRDRLMPINRKYPIEALLAACRQYPLRPRRRITFEYILIEGVNDDPEDAHRLAKLLQSIRCKINLIAFNPHAGGDFKRPSEAAIQQFRDVLLYHNYTTVIRYSKGLDISAACGQLNAKLRGKAAECEAMDADRLRS
ncbi:MAG: 23S rRNA (adenine(2503)-C(2))-methyltransferase RlmN [Thermodesulfobacteriota bacterium]